DGVSGPGRVRLAGVEQVAGTVVVVGVVVLQGRVRRVLIEVEPIAVRGPAGAVVVRLVVLDRHAGRVVGPDAGSALARDARLTVVVGDGALDRRPLDAAEHDAGAAVASAGGIAAS